MHGYVLYYCRGELDDEQKRLFRITNVFSYIQGTNRTTKCKKEGYDERSCIFLSLELSFIAVSQYFLTWYLGRSSLRDEVSPCACFCHFLSPNVKKCSQDHCSCLIKNNPGHYFHSFERFLRRILMPEKGLTASIIPFY